MKGKIIISNMIAILILAGCASTNYSSIALNNPDQLLAIEDSLQTHHPNNKKINQALTVAHNQVGLKALRSNDLQQAEMHFEKSLKITPLDTTAQYYSWIANGRQLMKTGKKNNIWDAIELFGKCNRLMPDNGEHHYWTGEAYYKIGDKDFDLILEAFTLATQKKLPPNLSEKAESELKKQIARKKKLDSFWK